MQVSVEKTSELSRKMIVTVSEDVVQGKVNERLKSLAREVKIDGFSSRESSTKSCAKDVWRAR